MNNAGFNLTISSAANNTVAGIITGSGSVIKTGAGTLTFTAASGNNTANTYTGTTTVSGVGTGTINVTGLSGITSTAITSATQSVTFSSASPANGTYKLFPGTLVVGAQSFSSSPATPTKLVTFDYTTSTVTVSDATITTSAISPVSYCAGSTVSVAFTSNVTLSGTYTAQLSDASGSFAAPVALGTNTASPIPATIPGGTAAGTGYRIRVVSSNEVTGSDNGGDITVVAPTVPTFNAMAPICSGSSFTLPASSTNGITGTWSPALNNTATTTYTFTPDSGQCATTATLTVTVNVCQSVVNLKLFIQGYYTGAGTMASVKYNQDGNSDDEEVEDLTIELRDASTLTLVATTDATLATDGTLTSIFPTAPDGLFYIVVRGSNLVETWSAVPQQVGSTPLDFDFSAAQSQAYTDGSQQSVVEVEPGVWAMYNGDVNQDGVIDIVDTSTVSNDSDSAAYGVLATDLNGDGIVDSFDFSQVSNNSDISIYTQRP
ncbi:dockerin type I domain-containing protein [Flavobacterium sp. 3HN19-14]|uniref:dockerin type I domain-containing protein n=1 Tax=Flavobacterium sp. 3HN19-14 TaxID=3448133 RepID=UPI003EDE7A40